MKSPVSTSRVALHASGVDDTEPLPWFLFQILFPIVFQVWVTFGEQKWYAKFRIMWSSGLRTA